MLIAAGLPAPAGPPVDPDPETDAASQVVLRSLETLSEPEIPADLETEVVAFKLQGLRRAYKLNLEDLDVLHDGAGQRLLPLVRLLDELEIEYSVSEGAVSFQTSDGTSVSIDLRAGVLRTGELERPVDLIVARSEITGRPEVYAPADFVALVLSFEVEWDELRYLYSVRTNHRWPLWRSAGSVSLLSTEVQQAEERLPEILPPAKPRSSSLDFMELQARLQASRGEGESLSDVNLQSARLSLWGTLGGGRYKVRLLNPRGFSAETLPSVAPEFIGWNYTMRQADIGAGDAIFGLSGLTFPSVRMFGVRINGIRAPFDVTPSTDRSSFVRPREFTGIAPLGSVVQLLIGGRTVAEDEVLPDVSSPSGMGRYRFEDVILRQGVLNDIRIVITEPGGTRRVITETALESPLLLPKKAWTYSGGVGTRREPLTFNTSGTFGGFRVQYGLANRLNLAATTGVQQDFYQRLTTSNPEERLFPLDSANAGLQLSWLPLRKLLVAADLGLSTGNGSDPTQAYDDQATELRLQAFPTQRLMLRTTMFRYGTDYFNGQNLQTADRQGGWLDGRHRFRSGDSTGWAVGHVEDNVEQTLPGTTVADFVQLSYGTSRVPRTSIYTQLNYLDATWEDRPATSLNFDTRSQLGRSLELNGRLRFGESSASEQAFSFLAGLNLPGLAVYQQDLQSLALIRRSQRFDAGVAYEHTDFRDRPTVFGRTNTRLFSRPVGVRAELGYDFFGENSTIASTTESPYFDGTFEFFLDSYGKSRLGLNTRLERGQWRTSLLASFLTSFSAGLKPSLLTERVNPEVGGVQGRVFVDYNANGVRDGNEPGLPDVKVFMGGQRQDVTDRSGHFMMSGFQRPDRTKIYLDMTTIPAIYSPTNGIQTALLEPGRMTIVNLGVTPLISITGSVLSTRTTAGRNTVSGVRVLLVDPVSSATLKDSITGSSGTYYLGGLHPGRYALDLDPATFPPGHVLAEGPRLIDVAPVKDVEEILLEPWTLQFSDPLRMTEAAPAELPPPRLAEADTTVPPPAAIGEFAGLAPAPAELPPPRLAEADTTVPPPAAIGEFAGLAPAPAELPPPTATGSLAVNWFPWGEVRVGDLPAETTPHTFEELEPGVYDVAIRHPSFGEVLRRVEIRPDADELLIGRFEIETPAAPHDELIARETETPAIESEPPAVELLLVETGSLSINWSPWARVKIGNMPEATTPYSFNELPAGTYDVELRHPELGQETRRVEIVAGEHVRLRGRFESTGILNVNAKPWANVLVDGQPRGATPLRIPVASGTHTILLQNPYTNGDAARFTVEIGPGGEKSVSYNF